MTTDYLIFEETTSPLHYSNDGRIAYDYSEGPIGTHVIRDRDSGEVVLATKSRELVDAFIAGFDLRAEMTDAATRDEVAETAKKRIAEARGGRTELSNVERLTFAQAIKKERDEAHATATRANDLLRDLDALAFSGRLAKRCAECGDPLTEAELEELERDHDFVEHGDRGHLIRIEP